MENNVTVEPGDTIVVSKAGVVYVVGDVHQPGGFIMENGNDITVLKAIAHILKSEAREIDRVGRYGGEEFLLILPGTVLDAAVTFAERLREKVENHTFAYEGGTLRRTMSCGVAAAPHPKVKDQEGLVRAADDALYVAKETGRNRVVRFDGTEFNAHTQSKGNDPTDGDKPVKEAAGGTSPGSPPRSTSSSETQRATA